MSLTITQQIPHQEQPELILQLQNKSPETVSEKVHELIVEMGKSTLFSLNDKEELCNWQKLYDSQWLNELLNDEARENVSLALCLLMDVIHQAIIHEKNLEKQIELLGFEDALKNILKLTIPSKESLEQFINDYQQFSSEEKSLNEQLKQIADVFEKVMDELFATANEVNNNLKSKFYHLKSTLLQIQEQFKQIANEANDHLDKMIQKVDNASQELLGYTIQFQVVAKRMENEQENLVKLLEECLQIKKL